MFDFIDKGLEKFKQTVAQAAGNFMPQQMHSPIPQQQQVPMPNPLQSAYQNATNSFWQSPVGQGLVNAQKFIESPQSINPVPQIQPFKGNTVQSNIGNFAANIPGNITNSFIAPAANAISDTAQNIGREIGGREPIAYNNLKSPLTRLAYNTAGVQRTPQQVLGNIAGTASDALTYAIPGAAENIGANAIEQASKQGLLNTVKNAALEGAKFGGIFGGLQGLSEGRNSPDLVHQFFTAAQSGAKGTVTGGVLGGVLGLGGSAFNTVTDALQRIQPQLSEAEIKEGAKSFIRDELGRFAKQGKPKDEPVFYGDLREQLGLPRNGNYQSGEVDLNANIGKNKQPDVNPNYTPITLKDGEVQPLDPKENLKQLLQLPTQKGESVAQKRGKTLSEDPFIRELEQEKLKQEDVGMGQSTNPIPQVNTPTINTDKSTQYEANIKGGGFDKIDPQVKQDFADWVNQRRATQVEGLLKKQQFSDLDSKGIQGIFEFQSGSKEGRYGDVKKYFDSKYQDIKDTGLDLNYKSDYLPQLWANSREEVEQKLGRSLGTNPSFSFESLIKNYKEGIEKNLTPRFNTVSDLVGWYERTANKAIADRNYFSKLASDGLIQPASKAPRDWITIDPDRFPKVKVKVAGEGSYVGTYKAPQELGTMINNYLKDPQHGFMNAIANFVSGAKNRTLSFGVPGTGINAHGINILARHTLFGTGGNPITRFITGSQYMLNPGSAESALTKNLSHAGDAVKNGLTLSAEDHNALLNEAENVATKFGKQWNNYFEKPLFGKMIPALKLSSYQELIKNGMDGKDAAKLVNNVYGGINWEQLGRNRDTQNLMRAIILAPDWAESTLRLGGNIAKSLTPFGGATGARYRAMAATLLGSYIAANVANKISSGHYMYENDTGHTFEIEAGFTGDGQKRYIRPYGTAVDFVRLPVDILQGLLRGDPSAAFRAFSNRLSIPLSNASHLLFNVDYKGNPIYGKTVSALQAAGGIGSELAGMAGTPSFIKNIADTATGKQGVEQGLTQSLELPLRYSGGEATKKIVTQLQAKNTSNQDINQQLQNMYQRSQNKQDVLQNISPEVKQALASIDQIKKLDPNDPQRKAAEALLFKLYPQAFAAQQQLAYLNSNNNENLVDPLYRHGNEQVAQKLLTYNSLPPSSAEKKQYYKNNADLGAFEEQRVNWQKQNPYTGSGNGFSYNPPPQPNNYVLQQMAAKNFNDPQVQQYLQDKNVYDNQQRQKWGLDTVDSYGNIQGSKNFGVSFSKGSSYALRRLKSQVNRPVKARKLKTSKPKMAKLRIKTAKLAKVKPLKLKV